MANKSLFNRRVPAADVVNEAGGAAYQLSPKAALAQYAATGCLNTTFYASAEQQLATVLNLCSHPDVEPEFIARVALYARTHGHMKDLPAVLCAVLSSFGPGLLAEVFDRVIDDGKMVRNFVQVMRSGTTGRKSLGSLPKRLVQQWFEPRTDEQVFRASVGNDPSLADVIRMVHPKPATASRAALYGYLLGQPHDAAALPEVVKAFEAFKADPAGRRETPNVPFQMLTGLPLTAGHWKGIAANAGWQMTRMNLNTFARHGVFDDAKLTRQIASRLRDPELVRKARVFPYQLMVAHTQASTAPTEVREALQDAMEHATHNVPTVAGQVYVCPDVSGSMGSPVTGHRKGSTSAVRCVDVAALVAACLLRANRDAEVIPFETAVVKGLTLNPRDTVLTNAAKLAAVGGGGTNCSAPLAWLNARGAVGDLVVYVSDNESWVDRARGRGTATMEQWDVFKRRSPDAKLVCIDLQPYSTAQAIDTGRGDVLNVGGFSDAVFDVVAQFAAGTLGTGHWVGAIEAMTL